MGVPTARLRVLIADDHTPTRAALRKDLEDGGIEVCAEAATGAQAIDAALRTRPDVCLIDVRMPDGDGIAATEAIHQALPSTKVVLITAAPDEAGAVAAARAGADGYLDKGIDPRRLPQVVKAVATSETAYPRRLTRVLLQAIQEASSERSET
jgi:two-component system, NarL family, nitrate/nitrite response regulator NarL